jgi:hypothetical protein
MEHSTSRPRGLSRIFLSGDAILLRDWPYVYELENIIQQGQES